jgi:hypothetical protein
MSTQTDPNAFLMGGGGRSAKFATIGDKIDGEITATEVTQQTDFTDGTPKTWPDGNPMMQLVITLQTDEREDDQDDGVRRVFAKGSARKATTTIGAVRAAVQAAGAKTLEVGGRLQLAYTGDGVAPKAGLNAPKEYKAKYTPPAAGSVNVDEIFGSD